MTAAKHLAGSPKRQRGEYGPPPHPAIAAPCRPPPHPAIAAPRRPPPAFPSLALRASRRRKQPPGRSATTTPYCRKPQAPARGIRPPTSPGHSGAAPPPTSPGHRGAVPPTTSPGHRGAAPPATRIPVARAPGFWAESGWCREGCPCPEGRAMGASEARMAKRSGHAVSIGPEGRSERPALGAWAPRPAKRAAAAADRTAATGKGRNRQPASDSSRAARPRPLAVPSR
jgi:hypothetical protein